MKKILSSTIQIFKQIKSDPMMFAACFSPFIMGTLIKFGIPFLYKVGSTLNYFGGHRFYCTVTFFIRKVVHWNDNMFGASRLSTGNYCFTYDYHIIKQ